MNKKQFLSKRNTSVALQILTGVILAQLINLIGSIVGAILLEKGILDDVGIGWYTVATWFIASFGATMILSIIFERNWIPICAVWGVHIGVLLCMNILLMEHGFSGIGKGIAAITAGVLPSVFIYFNKNILNKKKYKYRSM